MAWHHGGLHCSPAGLHFAVCRDGDHGIVVDPKGAGLPQGLRNALGFGAGGTLCLPLFGWCQFRIIFKIFLLQIFHHPILQVLGLPWMCAAAVQSLAHCSSLTVMKKTAPGAMPGGNFGNLNLYYLI